VESLAISRDPASSQKAHFNTASGFNMFGFYYRYLFRKKVFSHKLPSPVQGMAQAGFIACTIRLTRYNGFG
jgi:hypothetical protein